MFDLIESCIEIIDKVMKGQKERKSL